MEGNGSHNSTVDSANSLWREILEQILNTGFLAELEAGVDKAVVEKDVVESIAERVANQKAVPDFWLKLRDSMSAKTRGTAETLRQKQNALVYLLTKRVFLPKYYRVDDATINSVFNSFRDGFLAGRRHNRPKRRLYHQLLDYFSDDSSAGRIAIQKVHEKKIGIVRMVLEKSVVTQGDLRKLLRIPSRDRGNFKRLHIAPLLAEQVIIELKVDNSAKPLYTISRSFLDELKAAASSKHGSNKNSRAKDASGGGLELGFIDKWSKDCSRIEKLFVQKERKS